MEQQSRIVNERGRASEDIEDERLRKLGIDPEKMRIIRAARGLKRKRAGGASNDATEDEIEHQRQRQRRESRREPNLNATIRPAAIEQRQRQMKESRREPILNATIGPAAIKNMDAWYISKVVASERWYEVPSVERKRKCLREFQQYTNHDLVPTKVCGVCAELVEAAHSEMIHILSEELNVLAPTAGANPVIDKCGVEGEEVRVCQQCRWSLKRRTIPSLSICNGFDVGCPMEKPECLKGLTLVEERLISRSRNFGMIHKITGWSVEYLHSRGHLIVIPQKAEKLLEILPSPLLELCEKVKVVWVGKDAPSVAALRVNLQVRKSVVATALRWLIEHNPIYGDIVFNEEEMRGWPEAFVPEPLIRDITVVDPDEEEQNRSGYIDHAGDNANSGGGGIDEEEGEESLNDDRRSGGVAGNEDDMVDEWDQPLRTSALCDVDGTMEDSGPQIIEKILETVEGGDRGARSAREPYIQYTTGRQLQSSYSDARYYTATFPTLFWTGRGGHMEDRKPSVSFERWTSHMMKHHSRSFGSHGVFPFLVFNDLIRRKTSRATSIVAKRSSWAAVEASLSRLTKEVLRDAAESMKQGEWPKNRDLRELLKILTSVGNTIPLSNSVRQQMRTNVKGQSSCSYRREVMRFTACTCTARHIVKNGMPAIWFTLNPSDLLNPLVCRIAGEEVENVTDRETRQTLRNRVAVSNPVASARFFKLMMDGFFETLVRTSRSEKGIFGEVDAYFATTETNGRGALHAHGMLWLKGNLELSNLKERIKGDEEMRKHVISYIDEIVQSCIWEIGAEVAGRGAVNETEVDVAAEDFATELREDSNMVARQRNMHKHSPTCFKYKRGKGGCRFGAPWPLCQESTANEDGVVSTKRNDGYINNWSPCIASAFRSNHDINFIATKAQASALVYYITDYATKLDLPTYEYASLAASARDAHGKQNEQEGSSKGFVVRTFNKIATSRELGAVEICNALMQQPESYSSTQFKTININCVYAEVTKLYPELVEAHIAASRPEESEAGEEAIVRLGKGWKPVPYLQEYKYRGESLKEMCLYDYTAAVDIRKGEDQGRQPLPFAAEYRTNKRQFVQENPKAQKTVSFSGRGLVPSGEEEENEERRYAILAGLFVPWDSIKQHVTEQNNTFARVFAAAYPTLSERLKFHIANIDLLRKSAADVAIDKRNRRIGADPDVSSFYNDDHGLSDVEEGLSVTEGLTDVGLHRVARLAVQGIVKHGNQPGAVVWKGAIMANAVAADDDIAMVEHDEISVESFVADETRRCWVNWLRSENARIGKARNGWSDGRGREDEEEGNPNMIYNTERNDGWGDIGEPELTTEPLQADQIENAVRNVIVEQELNTKQRAVLVLVGDAIRNSLTVENRERTGEQLLLIVAGEGGTGKTRVINAISSLLRQLKRSHTLQLCALTGSAADNIRGATVHSALRIGTGKGRHPKITSAHRQCWGDKEFLIIDEMSMMDVEMLGNVEDNCRKLRTMDQPFGGLAAVILAGDFYQFPPIGGEALWAAEEGSKRSKNPKLQMYNELGRRAWMLFNKVVVLDEQMRQAGDQAYHELLLRARQGRMTENDYKVIMGRTVANVDLSGEEEERPKVITRRNAYRSHINLAGVFEYARKRSQTVYLFMAGHRTRERELSATELAELLEVGDDSTTKGPGLFPYTPGIPVVVTENLQANIGIVNGRHGIARRAILDRMSKMIAFGQNVVVVDRPPAAVIVAFHDNIPIEPIEGFRRNEAPILPRCVGSIKTQRRNGSASVNVSRTQVPLSPAFAITSHKCQGRTYSRVAIDFESCNMGSSLQEQYAHVTVPLSRVTTLDGLSVIRNVEARYILRQPDARLEKEMRRLRDLEKACLNEIGIGREGS